MAAAPRFGTMMYQTGQGGIGVDIYISDVVNAPVNFDSGNGAAATSETFWNAPANGAITDLSIATGLTDTTKGGFVIGGSRTKTTVRWANHINTLAFRTPLNIPCGAGEAIGMVQLA